MGPYNQRFYSVTLVIVATQLVAQGCASRGAGPAAETPKGHEAVLVAGTQRTFPVLANDGQAVPLRQAVEQLVPADYGVRWVGVDASRMSAPVTWQANQTWPDAIGEAVQAVPGLVVHVATGSRLVLVRAVSDDLRKLPPAQTTVGRADPKGATPAGASPGTASQQGVATATSATMPASTASKAQLPATQVVPLTPPVPSTTSPAQLRPAVLKTPVAVSSRGNAMPVPTRDDRGQSADVDELAASQLGTAEAVKATTTKDMAAKEAITRESTTKAAPTKAAAGARLMPAKLETEAPRPSQPADTRPADTRPTDARPTVLEPVSVSVRRAEPPAIQRWSINEDDKTLRVTLDRWAQQAGWRLFWEMGVDYPITASASVNGNFEDAIALVVRSMDQADVPPKAIFYRGNQVLRLVPRGKE